MTLEDIDRLDRLKEAAEEVGQALFLVAKGHYREARAHATGAHAEAVKLGLDGSEDWRARCKLVQQLANAVAAFCAVRAAR